MGNFCSDNTIKPRPHRQSRDFSQATKFYESNSTLKLQIQIWDNQILPNLRSDLNVLKSQCYLDKSGQLVFQEKQRKITFHDKEQQNKQNQRQSSETQDSNERNQKTKLVLNIQKSEKGYQLCFKNDFIYQLIKQPRELQLGQCILLGGTEYKFLKFIKDADYGKKRLKTITHFDDDRKDVKTRQYLNSFSKIPQHTQTPICRICMQQQISRQNPLICPCDCTGSVKFFHLNCWTEWAFTSPMSSEGMFVGNVKKQKCDICKLSLVNEPFYRQTVAALLSSVHKIKAPFIVLEGLKPMANFPYYNKVQLNYVILSFADKKRFTIGRGKTSDIKLIIDSSISRKNSIISLKNGKIIIQDDQSKHGTYIKTPKTVLVTDNSQKSFLYKNSLISAKIQ